MLNEKMSFEMMPGAVSKILTEMSEIKKMLTHRPVREPIPKEKLSFKKALSVLSDNGYQISKSRLYKLTSNKKIPHGKINNKLIFYKDDLIDWIDVQIITSSNTQVDSIINSAKSLHNKKNTNGKR